MSKEEIAGLAVMLAMMLDVRFGNERLTLTLSYIATSRISWMLSVG
jgi:hypothetical protein